MCSGLLIQIVGLIGRVGIATNDINPLVLSAGFTYFSPSFYSIGFYEWGPETSYFYIHQWVYTVKKFEIGIRGQRFKNDGLHIGFKLGKYVTMILNPGYDFEFEQTVIAGGINFSFF